MNVPRSCGRGLKQKKPRRSSGLKDRPVWVLWNKALKASSPDRQKNFSRKFARDSGGTSSLKGRGERERRVPRKEEADQKKEFQKNYEKEPWCEGYWRTNLQQHQKKKEMLNKRAKSRRTNFGGEGRKYPSERKELGRRWKASNCGNTLNKGAKTSLKHKKESKEIPCGSERCMGLSGKKKLHKGNLGKKEGREKKEKPLTKGCLTSKIKKPTDEDEPMIRKKRVNTQGD